MIANRSRASIDQQRFFGIEPRLTNHTIQSQGRDVAGSSAKDCSANQPFKTGVDVNRMLMAGKW
jgi:hypothetical protein